ncbi:uncharacterized protein [Amphiura filiformis]|uniref:uncharacterized protein n=1 Tax=Amphiura filiformis TaxID=82378 RepID=UPI003B2259CA
MDCDDDYDARKLRDIISSAGMKQHISGSTHKRGHTLDLVISRECDDPVTNPSVIHGMRSDHSAVSKEDEDTGDLETLVQRYDLILRELTDNHAPEVERRISLRPHAPWYNDSLREAKRKKRRLERKMKKSGLQVDKEIFQEHCGNYHKSLESAKKDHYKSNIKDCSQKQLFRFADKLTSAKPVKTLPAHCSLESLAEDFHGFFDGKIEKIHDKLSSTDVPTVSVNVVESCASSFSSFEEVDEEFVRKIISDSAKTSCGLDPMPTSILAKPEILDTTLPVITRIVNMSLLQGIVPSSLKRALVTPLIKKANSDPDVLQNYRPISNLPFLFKVIERVASNQIQKYVSENKLEGDRQSAYRKQHSTETALVRLSNDILRAVDIHQNVIVVLLNLTAAFDTLDHQTLLQRLRNRFGITGTAFRWMESYFQERQQCVTINSVCSEWKYVRQGPHRGPCSDQWHSHTTLRRLKKSLKHTAWSAWCTLTIARYTVALIIKTWTSACLPLKGASRISVAG